MKRDTRSKLIKKLDRVTSELVRRTEQGICFTCGIKQDWKQADAGHYIRRNVMRYRFSLLNVHVQCKNCNEFLSGNRHLYRKNLVKLYGEDVISEMEKEARKPYKMYSSALEVLLEEYSVKIMRLNSEA